MTGRHDLGARNAARWQYGAPGAVLLREHPGVNRGSDTMGLIAWIVVGAIAGFIATFITGTREGVLMTIVLGIVGALVGDFLAGLLLNVGTDRHQRRDHRRVRDRRDHRRFRREPAVRHPRRYSHGLTSRARDPDQERP